MIKGRLFGYVPARSPCMVQPSKLSLPQQQRLVRAAAASGDRDDGSSSGPRHEKANNASNHESGAQQQQNTWGSSWARRSGSRSQKPVSLFTKQSSDQHISSSSTNERATTASAAVDPALEASIRQNVDRAAQTLQEIITEVLNELLVEQASAYVLEEEGPTLQLNQAARNAVVKRLEWLDANFLAALNAYLSAPSVQANSELRSLLWTIREEVLDLVSARLPPSVQVLNAALDHSSREGRSHVITTALSGGSGAVPGASLDALGAAAAQLVEDMEDQQVVADRVLLARLVLLREELRLLAERQEAQQDFFRSSAQDASADDTQQQQQMPISPPSTDSSSNTSSSNRFFAFHRSNLPARCAAFMKELLAVPERDRRLGIISKAFQEDWVGEAPGPSKEPSPASSSSRPLRDNNFSHQSKPESLDIVRPGRFFSTLLAMRAELEQRLVDTGLGNGSGGETTLAVLQQMELIRLEALAALDRIQHNRLPASALAGRDSQMYDYELDMAE